jgi:hypothetical protein
MPARGIITPAVTQSAVTAAVSNVVAGAPAALDTLDELAAAFGDDANFAATVTTALAGKEASQTAASQAEAEAGTETAVRKFTPQRIAQAIAKLKAVPRVQSVTNSATITPNADADDAVDITAISQAFTIANPTGTPVNKQKLIIEIKDNGTARAITFGSAYVAGGVSLPTTTVSSKILVLGFIYSTANSLNKWRLVSSAQEA